MSRKVKSNPAIARQARHRSRNRQSEARKKQKLAQKNSQNLALRKNSRRNKVVSIGKSATAKTASRKRSAKISPLLLGIYLLTIAVGISTILGTAMAIANSFSTITKAEISAPTTQVSTVATKPNQLEHLFPISSLGKEMPDLKAKITSLTAKYPELEPGVFIFDLDTKGYVGINSTATVSSASTIKLPILIAFFQDVEAGKIHLEEKLTMTEELIAGGSGNMRYEKPGSKFSALKTASKMMVVSDNTATNMLIERMGGMETLNQRFDAWGLTATRLRNPLPDLEGANTTSPEDLGNLLAQIDRGELISLRSRDRVLHIMRNIVRNTLLPEGLDDDALIAHKTGDIKSVLGDVGAIDMPSGKRYIAAVLVKRPDNSPEAKELIQKISRVVYQHFKWQQSRSFTLESKPTTNIQVE